jgi:hypothetical protein
MTTNELYQVIVDAMTQTGCQDAFNQGLNLGALFVVGAAAVYMIHRIPGDGDSER